MDTNVEKFLTEAMGKCWHEGTSRCTKCGEAETIGKRVKNMDFES